MASTYTANNGIELITTGEQSGTWGDTTNTNLQIIDRAANGVLEIALSGTTHTLTTSDGTLSDGQNKVLVLGGAPSGTNTITIAPNTAEKFYMVANLSGEDAVFTQGTGGDATIPNGHTGLIYADGAGSGAAVVNALTLPKLGITATADEINLALDGVTASAAELNYNDITTLGTSEASKTVTADANGNVTLTEEVKATAYIETAVALSGTSVTVDCDEGNVFSLTTSGNTTFTFDYSGVDLSTDDSYSFVLILTGGGDYTLSWPASVNWNRGTAPNAPGTSEVQVYAFITYDGGTNWYGFRPGNVMS